MTVYDAGILIFEALRTYGFFIKIFCWVIIVLVNIYVNIYVTVIKHHEKK